MKEKKPLTKKKKILNIIGWVFTALFGTIFLVLGIAQVDGMIHKKEHFGESIRLGFGNFIVKTDSMEPEYKVKTAIVTFNKKPQDIYASYIKGETIDITFADRFKEHWIPKEERNASLNDQTTPTGEVMTHRLREIQVNPDKPLGRGRYIFFVAGINTKSEHQAAAGQYQAFSEQFILGVVVFNSPALGHVLYFMTQPYGLIIVLLIPAFYLVITSVMDMAKTLKSSEEEPVPADGKKEISSLDSLSDKDRERLKREMLDEMINKKAQAKKEEQHEDKE